MLILLLKAASALVALFVTACSSGAPPTHSQALEPARRDADQRLAVLPLRSIDLSPGNQKRLTAAEQKYVRDQVGPMVLNWLLEAPCTATHIFGSTKARETWPNKYEDLHRAGFAKLVGVHLERKKATLCFITRTTKMEQYRILSSEIPHHQAETPNDLIYRLYDLDDLKITHVSEASKAHWSIEPNELGKALGEEPMRGRSSVGGAVFAGSWQGLGRVVIAFMLLGLVAFFVVGIFGPAIAAAAGVAIFLLVVYAAFRAVIRLFGL